MSKRLMLRADLARHLNVHPSQVGRWIERGLPTLKGGRYIDPEIAERWLARSIDPEKRVMCQATKAAAAAQARVAERPYRGRPAVPPGTGHLQDDPVNGALACVLPVLAHRLPARAAAAVLAAGGSKEIAETVWKFMIMASMGEVAGLLDAAGVPAPPNTKSWQEASIWDASDFRQPDWTAAGAPDQVAGADTV
jgi:hypothetical protein